MNTPLTNILNNNGIAVVRTDTLYGVVGRAQSPEVVERIYKMKGRDSDKPFIILISNINHLQHFGIEVTESVTNILNTYWPGPISIILPVTKNIQQYHYLHRGTNSLAFRLPDDEYVKSIIDVTGPLVAPSANTQGNLPAKNITEAQAYFSDAVDYYDDQGEVRDIKASTILRVDSSGLLEVIRK